MAETLLDLLCLGCGDGFIVREADVGERPLMCPFCGEDVEPDPDEADAEEQREEDETEIG